MKTRSVTKKTLDLRDAQVKKTKNLNDIFPAIEDALDCFSEPKLLDYAQIIQDSFSVTAEDNTSFATYLDKDDGEDYADSYHKEGSSETNGVQILERLTQVLNHPCSSLRSQIKTTYELLLTQIYDVLEIHELFKEINEDNLADTNDCIAKILDQGNLGSFPAYKLETLQAKAYHIVYNQIAKEIAAFSPDLLRKQINDVVKIFKLHQEATSENTADIRIAVHNGICKYTNLQLEQINGILEIRDLFNAVSEENLAYTNNRIAEICAVQNLASSVLKYDVTVLQTRANHIVRQQAEDELNEYLARNSDNDTEIFSAADSDVVMQEENADNELPIIGHDHQGFDGY